MAVDTVVDAELWLILAAMIGWIVLGCFLTHLTITRTAALAAPKAHERLTASKRRETLAAKLRLQTSRRFHYKRDLA